MESLSLEIENRIEDIRNRFRLKKRQNYAAVRDIRNLFRKEKKLKQLKIRYYDILRTF